MEEKVATRALAEQAAVHRLNSYEPTSMELAEGEEVYIALIVRMPEDVANEANYRGAIEPRVELGIIGSAFQIIED